MREKLFNLVEPPQSEEHADFYDVILLLVIIVSIIPLAFKRTYLYL